MTDEEKAEELVKEITKKWVITDDLQSTFLFENRKKDIRMGIIAGLAEGRKEGYEQGKNNERESQCGKKNYEKDIARLEKDLAESKAEIKQIIERERVVPEHYLCEMIELIKKMKEDINTLYLSNSYTSRQTLKQLLQKWEAEK